MNKGSDHRKRRGVAPAIGTGPAHRTGFGTVLGYYSVAELKDLILAKDATLRNMARRFEQIKDQPLDFSTFLPAYQNLINRYNTARAAGQAAINAAVDAWRPMNAIIADEEYQNILSALNSRWKEHTWAEGDGSIDDLWSQLMAFGATDASNDEKIPQPAQGSDLDFNAYTASVQATGGPSGPSSWLDAKHLIAYGLVGVAITLFLLPLMAPPTTILLRK
jgi:hypothetical protein